MLGTMRPNIKNDMLQKRNSNLASSGSIILPSFAGVVRSESKTGKNALMAVISVILLMLPIASVRPEMDTAVHQVQ